MWKSTGRKQTKLAVRRNLESDNEEVTVSNYSVDWSTVIQHEESLVHSDITHRHYDNLIYSSEETNK